MGNQTVGDLVTNGIQNANVIGCEVLNFFLVCNFKATDGVVTKLDWGDQDIPGGGVQLLVQGEILTALSLTIWGGAIFDVDTLASVEDC
mgnify:CR=1 FL=1